MGARRVCYLATYLKSRSTRVVQDAVRHSPNSDTSLGEVYETNWDAAPSTSLRVRGDSRFQVTLLVGGPWMWRGDGPRVHHPFDQTTRPFARLP